VRGKHRYQRRRRRSIPTEWRRPLAALTVLCAGVLLVATGLLVGHFLIVWALLALGALILGLVLLAGDAGPEWPDWPAPEDTRPGERAGAPGKPSGAWNGGGKPAHADRHTPAR